MIAVRAQQVKGGVNTHSLHTPAPSNRLPYVYRADPVALDCLGLDLTARAVFVLLLDNAKSKGWRSRLSNATIGRILGRCPMTISRALGRLEKAGLIHRELAAGGRIRTGILITWEGVRREDPTEQALVRREDPTGSAQASNGVRRASPTDQSPGIQSERNQTAPISPSLEEDAEQAALFAELGPAEYLRMMVRKGRKQTATPKPATPSPTPLVSQPSEDALRLTLGSMVGQLGAALSLDELRPPRRRR